ncbi:FAD-dependent oxidoreductase [Sapientia aquatica]|uniref:FAD-dependent oxidoreductase n=1 Tax=Sapientia aquatica TaxID=1549640 RepID=A0A4R5W5N7_9BURK|nr:FAD-dependent oxidoreductase [Sapientia aquatica]TDK68451.1 FAD-dependent oxidoreductase [Sapientia aquatica]
MRVAVIGAGVVGMTTAYFLAQNGHQVSVIEQRGNVSEEASLAHAGLLGPAHLAPLGAPGMVKRILSQWLNSNSTVKLNPSFRLAQWSWLRAWMRECSAEKLLINKEKLQRLGAYGQHLLTDIEHLHNLDFQHRNGVLQLFRTTKEQQKIRAGLAVLTDAGIPFQVLDTAACHQLEPALNQQTALVGGVYMPQDGQGNCVLFSKQLKLITQQLDVKFEFASACEQIQSNKNGVTLLLKQGDLANHVQFDAVVIAAGANSSLFFKQIGIDLPVAQFQSYSATASIKNNEDSPNISIIDEYEQTVITRMDKRIRVAGTLRLGKNSKKTDEIAWQNLRQIATDWFPNAANYHTAQTLTSEHLMLPDGVPLIGPTCKANVFVNLAHAENGWAMATGAGKIIADLISDIKPDINLDGIGLLR